MIDSDAASSMLGDPSGVRRATYPCSQSQLRFWVEEQLTPHNPALNVAVRWRLEGNVAQPVLDECWRRLIARHAALRTALRSTDGEPTQVVEAHVPFRVGRVDLRDLPAAERWQEADRLAEVEGRTPFDIARAPLIRVTRLIIAEDVSMLLVTAHHAVCDGWSVGILAGEMGQIYAALEAGVAPFLPELKVQFGEFAAWELEGIRSGSFDGERAAVAELLRGFKAFELLPDHPRPKHLTSDGAIESVLLDRALTDALARLARDNGCTLFMTALSALFVVLNRYSGEDDILLSTQVAGRDDEDLEKLVGCFINTVALRGDLSGQPDFVTVMERTRDMVSESFDCRALPLQQLIEIAEPVRDPSRNALFSLNFIFQRSFIQNQTYGSFKLVDLPSRSAGALYDINVFMVERPEGWRLSCEYNTALFEAATITGLLERLERVLTTVAVDAMQPIGGLEILSAADRALLVTGLNRTRAAYPDQATVPHLFAEVVARTPDAIALRCKSVGLTYAQLDAAAGRLAGELVERGCAPGSRVGILLDRSPEMVIAMLAVLRAGCAYVPLDPGYPVERIAFIAADADLTATLTRRRLSSRIDAAAGSVILVDADHPASAPLAESRAGAGDIAYTIYTSGSTGKPKGVQISHRALVNFLCSMRERPGLDARDTLVAVTTISFDIAGLELFLPLITGAALVIATEDDVIDGVALANVLRESGATVMQATPVTWQLLLDAGWMGSPGFRMLCGGEALPRPLADQLLERGAELWNMYGPTETTIWSAAARVARGSGPVLIGPPIANTQFYVLDAAGRLVPPGVPGELYIGGDGVARGYFNRPELTRDRFVPDVFGSWPDATMYRTGDIVRTRPGGMLEFLGRTDQQIKLRGFRIELDEIVAALLARPGVAEAVAIAVDDPPGGASIRAFVVARPDLGVDRAAWPAALRSQIAEFLPNYMLPATLDVLERLPRTPNGKIDRAALPRTASRPVADPTRTATEDIIAEVAAELLGRTGIGRADNLFALGFHSLLVVRLVARLAQRFEVRVPLRTVFDRPTIADVAAYIDAATTASAVPRVEPTADIVVYNAGGDRAPFVFLHSDAEAEGLYCGRLSRAIGAAQPFYALAPHGSAGLPVLPTIEAMARDYIVRLKALLPHGPYRLGGHCVGGIVAFEVARQLRSQGERVDVLVLVNSYAPTRLGVKAVNALVRFVGLNASLGWRLREKVGLNIARFMECADRGPAAVLRFFGARLSTVLRLRERERANALAHPEIIERVPGTRETEAYFAYTVAGFTYHPAEPYAGAVTLVASDGEGLSMGDPNRGDATLGWAKLAPRTRVVAISGGHNSPVQERVEELAGIIAQELAR